MLTAVTEDEGRLDYRVHFMMALLADHTGDVARAMESLKRAVFLSKGFVIGHYYLGVIYHREGDTAIAKRHFKNVIRLLESVPDDQMLEESEGLNAGRLKEIVTARYEELNLV
jgi:chemotaxis protein methyltransferase CheR